MNIESKKEQINELQKEYTKLNKSLSPFGKYLLLGASIGAVIVNYQPLFGAVFPIVGGVFGLYKERKKNERIKTIKNGIKNLEKEIKEEAKNSKKVENILYRVNNKEYNKEEIEKMISTIDNNPMILEESNSHSKKITNYKN